MSWIFFKFSRRKKFVGMRQETKPMTVNSPEFRCLWFELQQLSDGRLRNAGTEEFYEKKENVIRACEQ